MSVVCALFSLLTENFGCATVEPSPPAPIAVKVRIERSCKDAYIYIRIYIYIYIYIYVTMILGKQKQTVCVVWVAHLSVHRYATFSSIHRYATFSSIQTRPYICCGWVGGLVGVGMGGIRFSCYCVRHRHTYICVSHVASAAFVSSIWCLKPATVRWIPHSAVLRPHDKSCRDCAV